MSQSGALQQGFPLLYLFQKKKQSGAFLVSGVVFSFCGALSLSTHKCLLDDFLQGKLSLPVIMH
jgi:hypothetical protein